MSQGYLSRVDINAAWMRRLFNLWPPFRAAGIRVAHIDPDFRRVAVELRAGLLNRNFVGSHFGGSRHEPTYRVEIADGRGLPVAAVEKTLYIRRADSHWKRGQIPFSHFVDAGTEKGI